MQTVSQSNLLSVWHISGDRTSGSHRKEGGASVNLDRAMLQAASTASQEVAKADGGSATVNVSQKHLKDCKASRIRDSVLPTLAI